MIFASRGASAAGGMSPATTGASGHPQPQLGGGHGEAVSGRDGTSRTPAESAYIESF